nr:hypothetical protein [uncultured Duganella sp.]
MSIDKLKLAAAWLLLAAAATLLRFKTALQSDSLFLDSLFTDLFHHGGRWVEWKFIQAPAFLPDMLLYLIAYPLLPDAASRIFFVSVAQVFLLAAAVLWCARQIQPQLSRSAQSVLLLLLALVTVTAAQSNMWLYFYSTNNHLGATLFGLLALGLLLRELRQPATPGRTNWRLAAGLTLLFAAAQVSTKLFALTFIVPLVALTVLALFALPRQAPQRSRAWLLIGVAVASQLLAAVLNKLLIHNIPYEGHTHASPDSVANALKLFMQATAAAFAGDNRWTQALSILLVLALLYLLASALRGLRLDTDGPALGWHRLGGELGAGYGAAAALLAASLPLTVVGAIGSAGFVDLNSYRYFIFPLTLAAMLAVVLLDHRYRQRQPLWHAAVLLGAGVVAAGAVQLSRNPPPQVDTAKLVAACVAATETSGFVLQAGVGDYWNGTAVSYFLPRHNPMQVTLNDATPLYWVNTLGPMLRPQDYPQHQHYNFAVLRNPGAGGQFNYTPETIGKVLPPPNRVQACPGTDMQVWLYDTAQLSTTMARLRAAYLANRH